jgi:hypothetical protein
MQMKKWNASLAVLSPFILAMGISAMSPQVKADSSPENAAPLVMASEAAAWPATIQGQIKDSTTNLPIEDVPIAFDGVEHKSDANGTFSIPGGGTGNLIIKKAGYRKVVLNPRAGAVNISLDPQEINGVYIQSGIFKNHQSLVRKNIEDLLATTELNALVVDVKDDDGHVSGGFKPYIDEMHAKGFYMIARIVTMKDNTEPKKNPTMALTDKNTGLPWTDKKGTTYLNPYNEDAQQYVIDIAKGAVEQGFDEVEFDYVRFPTDGRRGDVKWSTDDFSADTRTKAIAEFLKKAQEELGGMGAFVAADVFGDTADVAASSDSGIGQRIADITPYLDYVCPMVYPSGYAGGQDGYAIPTDNPGEVVEKEIYKYRLRSDKETVIRPWLQAFQDYAFNHRAYGAQEIRAQIEGSTNSSAIGFILWNASNKYSNAGLNKKGEHEVRRAHAIK